MGVLGAGLRGQLLLQRGRAHDGLLLHLQSLLLQLVGQLLLHVAAPEQKTSFDCHHVYTLFICLATIT